MKVPNKRELQQTALNHSSDIDIYKKCTAEPYSFLVNDATLASDNPLRLRKNLVKQRYNKIMVVDDQIRDEKLQYNIKREAAKISALLSNKFNKYKYLTGQETLPSNQKKKKMIEQAKFTYSPLGKTFEKQIKAIEDQGEKQVKALKNLKDNNNNKKKQIYDTNDYKNELLFSKEREIFKELDKIDKLSKKTDYNNLNYIVKSTGSKTDFSRVEDPITFF